MVIPFLLKLAIGIALFTGVALATVWLLRIAAVRRFVRLVYWTRYSFLFGIFLFAFPLCAYFFARTLLYGLLILEPIAGWDVVWKFAVVTWVSFMAALMVITTFRVTKHNGEIRFVARSDKRAETKTATVEAKTPESPVSIWRGLQSRWLLFLFLGLWIPAWSAWATYGDYRVQDERTALLADMPAQRVERIERNDITARGVAQQSLAGVAVGALGALLMLFLLGFLQGLLFPRTVERAQLLPLEKQRVREAGAVSKWLATVLSKLGPGYVFPDGRLRAGNAQLLMLVFILLGFYLAFYWWSWWQNAIPTDGSHFSALFFLLVVTTILGFVVTGLAYFLDYFHIPTLLVVVALVAATHWIYDVDHYFELNPATGSHAVAAKAPLATEWVVGEPKQPASLDLDDALDGWHFPEGPAEKGGTLVVVAAAGGGIQAAAWTAHVLTGLDEELEGFSESIGLVSGVSGGSVGLMYYLQERGPRSDDPRNPQTISDAARGRIRRLAESSSLEATAWGFAFPDLMRLIFPPAVDRQIDRGWALELDWQRRLGTDDEPDDTRMSDWAKLIADRKMPIVALNASFADTGESLILSPVVEKITGSAPQEQLLEYYKSYDPNPRITTAARLSATFSYVSPICKPLPDKLPANGLDDPVLTHRVADGGYVDNGGLLTATRWLNRLIESHWRKNIAPPFRNVILLRIVPFPSVEQDLDRAGILGQAGLVWEVFGPIFALNAARGSSQSVRGDWEIQLIAQALRDRERQQIAETSANKLAAVMSELRKADNVTLPEWARSGKVSVADFAQQPEGYLSTARKIVAADSSLDEPAKTRQYEKLESVERIAETWPRINIYALELRPDQRPDEARPPLSWKLTPSEKQSVRNAWARLAERIRKDLPQPRPIGEPLEAADLKRFFNAR